MLKFEHIKYFLVVGSRFDHSYCYILLKKTCTQAKARGFSG